MKQQTTIPYTVKHQCVALKEVGKSNREIYNFYCSVMGNTQNYKSFKLTLLRWRKKIELDPKFVTDNEIMHNVNLGLGYNMGKATVQYNAQTKEIEKVWARIKENEKSDIERLLEKIETNTQPRLIEREEIEVNENRLLEISLFDMHFGVTTYEYYKPTQARIIDKIFSRKWEEILITIGQDMIHTDNNRGQTASGTIIGKVDLEKAWEDCDLFYDAIFRFSLSQSKKVIVKYSKGNHDESMAWVFSKMLEKAYPECEYDLSFKQLKIHTFGYNFIGLTHGEKQRKHLHNIFPVKFPMEWAKAKNREVHIGHLHKEDLKASDMYGTVVRTLATGNMTDEWHEDELYIGPNKRFMLFEYSTDKLESIHYV